MSAASLKARWESAWPAALAAWSRYTQLQPPLLFDHHAGARREGLDGSFAMIRLQDQVIVVDLAEAARCGVGDYAVEILAHEIGHHVLAPATLTDHARCLARMRHALPTLESQAPMVANLYTDLLINDRLQRSGGLRMDAIFRRLAELKGDGAPGAVWTLYLRIYELLWSLPRGSLGGGPTDDTLEGDAWLGMRLVRSYAADWLQAAGKFAALLLPHLLADTEVARTFAPLHDTRQAGQGGVPAGLTEEQPGERDNAHPALDPRLSGIDEDRADDDVSSATQTPLPAAPAPLPGGGQQRQPFEYGEILRAAGWPGDDHAAAVAYYRELAHRYLVRYPRRRAPESTELLPEGLEPWDIGDPLDQCDWLQTVLQSPHVVPGLTTVQRVYGPTPGREPRPEPLDLDLYVDSSGSMPNPAVQLSYPALAGAIIIISALRAGARVQATLWSGKHQFRTTAGFLRDEEALLRVLTAHYGGGTQFPLHALRDTYAARPPGERPVHILSISDDGVTTMFDDPDERGTTGWSVCAGALASARGGATLALNIPADWATSAGSQTVAKTLRRARDRHGWNIHAVPTLDGLIEFARAFSRQKFGRLPTTMPAGRT